MKRILCVLSVALLALFGGQLAVLAASSRSNAPVVPPPTPPDPPPGPGGGGGGGSGGGGGGGGGGGSGPSTGGDPICYVDGSVLEVETDVRVRCPGLDLVFKRAYTSSSERSEELGLGWTHSYDIRLEPVESNRVRVCRSADFAASGWASSVRFPVPEPGSSSVAEAGPFRLRRETDGTWAFQTPDLLTYRFSASSNLASIVHASGASVTLERDDGGRLLRAVHSNGKALSFSHVWNGLITSVSTPDPDFSVHYGYSKETNVYGEAFVLLNRVRNVFHGRTGVVTYAYAPDPTPGKTHYALPPGWDNPGFRKEEGLCWCPPPEVIVTHYVLTEKTDVNGFHVWYDYLRDTDSPVARCGAMFSSDGYLETTLSYSTNVTVETKPTAFGPATMRLFHDELLRETRRETADEARLTVYDASGDEVGSLLTNRATAAYSASTLAYGDFHNVTSTAYALDGREAGRWTVEWHEGLLARRRRVSPEGRVREWTLDGNVFTLFPAGASCPSGAVRLVCTDDWRPLAMTDANGARTSFAYDAGGYLARVEPDALPSTAYTYDALGHIASETRPGPSGGRVTSYTRNRRGNPLRVVHPDGVSESFVWNGSGARVVEHVDRAGRTDVYRWILGHPLHAGRVVGGVTNRLWSVAYDPQLNVVSVGDPLGRAAETYALDENERVVAVTNLEGQAMARTYRLGDLPASVTRFDGTPVSYGWDGAANLARVDYPDAALAFTYDGDGLLTSASNAVGVVTNVYDAATGWLASTRGADGTAVSFAYHPGGEVASAVSVAGTTAYTLDAANRTARIESPEGTFRFGHCAWNGLVASVTNVNGLVASYAYDILDRVTNISWTVDGAPLGGFSYAYDVLGRITARRHALGADAFDRAYAYDGLDRLAADGPVSYTWDAAGNRTAKRGGAEGDVAYALGDGDRLASWTGGAYTYDAAGNVTRIVRDGRPTLDLAWNGQYQLVSVSTNGVLAESYAYDALGRRASTTTRDGTVRHVYGRTWQVLADLDGAGNVLRSYTWGGGVDNLLAARVGAKAYAALTDAQGTVWGLVGGDGGIAARWTYDAWGNVLSEEVSDPDLAAFRYRFQGREFSAATGLVNFRARWYDPGTGRWLSKDPIRILGGLNQYEFCNGDSVNCSDPIGWAHIATRPLDAGGSRKGQAINNALSRLDLPGDIDPRHAEIFFDDGKEGAPSHMGYSDRGPHQDDSGIPYNRHGPNIYDDATMRRAVENVSSNSEWDGENYNFVFHNCQDFVSAAIREYNRLMEERK